MDVLLAHQRAVEDDSKYIRSSFHGLDPQLRSVLHTTLQHAAPDDPSAPVLQAVVVFATPVRLHDALESLNRCALNHRDAGGFPIRIAACSSRDPQEAHERLRLDPPSLLLTDAATLDRCLMGWSGPELRDRLRSNLRVLAVAGDAHDCTRLQAAELALLVRRLQTQCEQALSCIGSPVLPDPLHAELLRAHLYALAVAEMGLPEVSRTGARPPSLAGFVDETQPGLPLRPALRPGPRARERLHVAFEQTLQAHSGRFDHDGVARALDLLPRQLDQALDRWRTLYRAARCTLERATYKVQSGLLSPGSGAFLEQQRRQEEGTRQLQLLCNACSDAGAWPEFHPARFLAAEGVLPGHGETRHPLRLFLSAAQGPGQFISRPCPTALLECGPPALVHHQGRRYRVTGIALPQSDSALAEAKLCRSCGCLLEGEQRRRESCPVCGASLSEAGASERLHDLLEMSAAHAEEADAASLAGDPDACGFDIETCYGVGDNHTGAVRQAWLKAGEESLLNLRFIPDARLVQINRGWSGSEEEGFLLNLLDGAWHRPEPRTPSTQPQPMRRVRLQAACRADALLLSAAGFPGLEPEGVAVLWQVLLRAIEQRFQPAAGELGVARVGQNGRPGLLLHETEAGGLGLLSRLMEPDAFQAVMAQARALCRRPNAVPGAPDRQGDGDGDARLGDALDRLCRAALALPPAVAEEDYDARYARLLRQLDPASTASRRFLGHLHAHRLRLPDAVRRRVPGLYLRPDFHFEPRTWVFCDGASPDALTAAEEHAALREEVLARGDEVWVWHAAEDLAAKLAQRPDLFGPAR